MSTYVRVQLDLHFKNKMIKFKISKYWCHFTGRAPAYGAHSIYRELAQLKQSIYIGQRLYRPAKLAYIIYTLVKISKVKVMDAIIYLEIGIF